MQTRDIIDWCSNGDVPEGGEADLCNEFLGVVSDTNIVAVGYVRFSLSSTPDILSSYPESWINLYMEKRLYRIDPIVTEARSSVLPVVWDSKDAVGRHREFFALAKQHGVPPRGIAIAARLPTGGVGVCLLASSASPREWNRTVEKRFQDLLLMGIVFHEKVCGCRSASGKKLSPREAEVLRWAARGKTAWETGAIIGLTEGTVNQYLRAAIVKMGASSKLQCVVRAGELGLITL